MVNKIQDRDQTEHESQIQKEFFIKIKLTNVCYKLQDY